MLGFPGDQEVSGLDAVGRRRRPGVTGLVGDSFLVGIDYRVQNGTLHGLGERDRSYLIEEEAARAAKVGQVVTGLNGTALGVDLKPAGNALRIVSDRGQNLRQPFGPGEATSGDTVTDGSLNTNGGITEGVAAAACTNNDLDPTTATSLFVINTAVDQVALRSPASSGRWRPPVRSVSTHPRGPAPTSTPSWWTPRRSRRPASPPSRRTATSRCTRWTCSPVPLPRWAPSSSPSPTWRSRWAERLV